MLLNEQLESLETELLITSDLDGDQVEPDEEMDTEEESDDEEAAGVADEGDEADTEEAGEDESAV